MTSSEQRTAVDESRRNTFQKMLEAERMAKLSRVQAASSSEAPPPLLRSSTSFPSLPSSNSPPAAPSLLTTGRSMTTPSLSINIPPPKTKYAVQDGDVISEQEEQDSDAPTSASSICQSPGWDDMMGKKRKKEKEEAKKRKKEREKAEAKALAKSKAEVKQAEKLRNRLTKPAPPPNKRRSKMSFMMNRSSSTPVIPQIRPQLKPLLEESLPIEQHGSQVQPVSPLTIPLPWKTAHGTPVDYVSRAPSPVQDDVPAQPSLHKNDGFIGGLKLKLVDEASAQEKQRRRSPIEGQRKDHPETGQGCNIDLGRSGMERVLQPVNNTPPHSSDGNLTRTSQQWESIYEQAARLIRSDSPMTGSSDPSSAESNVRRPRKQSRPPTSYFPEYLEETSTLRDLSLASHQRNGSQPRTSDDRDSHGRPSSAFSSDRPSLDTRDTSVERGTSIERGRVSAQGYVGHQRKQNDERSIRGYADERKVSEDTHKAFMSRGRRMSSASIKSFNRSSSTDASSTIKSVPRAHQSGSVPPRVQRASISSSTTPEARDSNVLGLPAESSLHQRRSSIKGSLPVIKGIKSAAKAAFTWSPTVASSAESDVSARDISSTKTGHSRQRSSTISIASSRAEVRSLSKAERFFGQPLSADSCVSPADSRSVTSGYVTSPSLSNSSMDRKLHDNRAGQRDDQYRSATDSSEGYSTLDESSGITTPMASNPNSYYEYSPKDEDEDLVRNHDLDQKYKRTQSFLMTNAMPPKVPGTPRFSGPDSRLPASRISLAPQVPTVPNISIATDGQDKSASTTRRPSLTRSASTSDLQQDLSFLPVLKHQPLTRPSKDKALSGKERPSPFPNEQQPSVPQDGLLIKPEMPDSSVTNTDGPGKPVSSQYLQNARLSISKPPPRAGPSPPTQGGADPIAKMFVVCCSCKYFHDMPSKIYECMARSESLVEDKDLGVSGVVSTSVRCPWCAHGMTTACCAGYAAVVVLREKLH